MVIGNGSSDDALVAGHSGDRGGEVSDDQYGLFADSNLDHLFYGEIDREWIYNSTYNGYAQIRVYHHALFPMYKKEKSI